jgi:hypothetical protein
MRLGVGGSGKMGNPKGATLRIFHPPIAETCEIEVPGPRSKRVSTEDRIPRKVGACTLDCVKRSVRFSRKREEGGIPFKMLRGQRMDRIGGNPTARRAVRHEKLLLTL